MTAPVRKTWRVILFTGVFIFSLRFIHPYPIEFSIKQAGQLTEMANNMGFRDPEMFYLLCVMLINTFISILIYWVIMKIWTIFRARQQNRH